MGNLRQGKAEVGRLPAYLLYSFGFARKVFKLDPSGWMWGRTEDGICFGS